MNERIEKLLNDLTEAVKETWGEPAQFHVSLCKDGFQSISVEEWEENPELPIEAWKRRKLYDSCRYIGEKWRADRSGEQNEYYRRGNRLLEKREG
jgi:hypothetical protein